jgi:hypothetical protein
VTPPHDLGDAVATAAHLFARGTPSARRAGFGRAPNGIRICRVAPHHLLARRAQDVTLEIVDPKGSS